ncbi:CapA family protein [candidate division WWE3 bacterium]|nr:CapA family protein [candidate division WWE3 bacterium]
MNRILNHRIWTLLIGCALILTSLSSVVWLLTHNGSVYYSYLPEQLQQVTTISSTNTIPEIEQSIHQLSLENHQYVVTKENGDIHLSNKPNEGEILHERYYVAVTAFNALVDTISSQELLNLIATHQTNSEFNSVMFTSVSKEEINQIFGTHVSDLSLTDLSALRETITSKTVAVIPFDQLTPDLKVLSIDGKNILDTAYDGANWPLKIVVTVSGNEAQPIIATLRHAVPERNRNTSAMTSMVLTGVTAISRGVEYAIEQHKDTLFPARGVMDVLSKADITHIDNENPLFDNCKPEKEGIVLCGRTTSIDSLKAIGTDIADLTGNHQNDYGIEKNLESIRHLQDAGIEYYGGGKNEQDAQKILVKDIKGTTFAFTGYNYFDSLNGPGYVSLAKGDHPGANYYSEEKMNQTVTEARSKAEIVQVDYQFIETYQYNPIPDQISVFRKTIDAGADIVVGVQSHQPQKIEFYKNGVIFYGLGNLFFDQMWSVPTRQGIIPRLTFIDGKLVSIELLTTLLFDYAQPRFVTGEDRISILKNILPTGQ